MNRVLIVFIAAVMLAGVCWYSAVTAQTKAGHSRWEYRIESYEQIKKLSGDNKDLTIGLNKLGQDGWELATADGLSREALLQETTDPAKADRLREHGRGLFVFKRAKQ